MQVRIGEFLATKRLSENSRAAYASDLEQFLRVVANQVTKSKLQVYETFLMDLKPRVRQRKLSAVNQFLYYLYDKGLVPDYHRLRMVDKVVTAPAQPSHVALDILWQETSHQAGQLAALLIWQLGLRPSELLVLQTADIDRDFQVMTVRAGDRIRVLNLPEQLMPYLETWPAGLYLFDKKGSPFSRQWLFRTLTTYLKSLGLSEVTAQHLREQYILQALNKGVSRKELAKRLGLKSPLNLEKY